MPDVFVSYAREDRERVRPLVVALQQQGWDVWWDSGIRHGSNYRAAIQTALQDARCVLVVWSRHSIHSDWVHDEADHGRKRGILVPVVIDPAVDPPLGFRALQTADLSGWAEDRQDPAALDELRRDIASLLGDPAARIQQIGGPAVRTRPRGGARGTVAKRGWIAAGVGSIIAAAALALQLPNLAGDDTDRREGPPLAASADSLDEAAAGPSAPSESPADEDAGAALADLWCSVPSSGGNPLAERVARLAPLRFSVDTSEHVLLGMSSQPVPIAPAAGLGRLRDRRYLVAHFSAGTALGVEQYFQRPGIGASVHVLIARDGTVKQLVPFDYAAFHAGQSSWNGLTSLNRHSLALDLENWGPLTRSEDGWRAPGGALVPDSQVYVPRSAAARNAAAWHRYTPEQIRAFFQVACALRRAYPEIEDLLGHDQISPGRKLDPGPAFPMREMRRRLFLRS